MISSFHIYDLLFIITFARSFVLLTLNQIIMRVKLIFFVAFTLIMISSVQIIKCSSSSSRESTDPFEFLKESEYEYKKNEKTISGIFFIELIWLSRNNNLNISQNQTMNMMKMFKNFPVINRNQRQRTEITLSTSKVIFKSWFILCIQFRYFTRTKTSFGCKSDWQICEMKSIGWQQQPQIRSLILVNMLHHDSCTMNSSIMVKWKISLSHHNSS